MAPVASPSSGSLSSEHDIEDFLKTFGKDPELLQIQRGSSEGSADALDGETAERSRSVAKANAAL